MSSSRNDAAVLPQEILPGLTPRLAAALAASLALHAYVIVALDALPRGMRWGDPGMLESGGRPPLRARLREVAPDADPQPSAAPSPAEAPLAPAAAPGAGATQESSLSPLPALHYYTTRELDVRPGILVHVEPDYPEAAARRFLSGRVVARLLIDESGAVEKVAIVSAEPPGYFEAAAEKAFLAARFTPGQKGGRNVRVQLLLEINFDSPKPPERPGA